MKITNAMLMGSVLATAMVSVWAEEDEDDLEDDVAQRLSVKTIFPDFHPDDAVFTTGQEARALVQFENGADKTFNVEYVVANLANAQAAYQLTHNISGIAVNRTVNQGETVSIEYKFTLDEKIVEPKEHNLIVTVYYVDEDESAHRAAAAFNETVVVQDGSSAFDLQGLFLAFLISVGFFLAYNHHTGGKALKQVAAVSKPAPRSAPSTSPAPEAAATVDGVDMSYIPKQHAAAARARSGSPKKRN